MTRVMKVKTIGKVLSTMLLGGAIAFSVALHPEHPYFASLTVTLLWMSAVLQSWTDGLGS